MKFDPDAYLAGDTGEFDPDAYLTDAQAPFANGPLKIGADAFPDQLRQELKDAGWAGRNLAGMGSAVVNAYQGLKGAIPGLDSDPNQVRDQKIIAESAPVGNIAGNVAMLAPTALIPGANTALGAATIGAVQGALLTPGDIKARAMAAGFGGAGGAAGAGLSRMMAGRAPIRPNQDARTLTREGISLTPGQNLGGAAARMEEKLMSAPVVGDVIRNARQRGIEDFNRAALRRAQIPGAETDDIGGAALQTIRQGLGDRYDDVLSRSSVDVLDPDFAQRMGNLRALAANLPDRERQAFDNILQREIMERATPAGRIGGENLQAAQSGLRVQRENFGQSNDGFQRQLGNALRQADEELRSLVATANPQNAAELNQINTAYANFKRLQRAASGVGAEDGVFTPAQLHSAVKAMDKSKDKRAFSEGTALLQDLSSAGKSTLGGRVPNSGTADRLAADITNPMRWPGLAAGAAASIPLAALYSRPGAAATNALMNRGALPLAELLRLRAANNPDALRLMGMAFPQAELMGN